MEPFWFFTLVCCLFALGPSIVGNGLEAPFCGTYRKGRVVKGRPQCTYTRRTCPVGMHACQACGLWGHGAEECRCIESTTEVEPPTETSASAASAAPPTDTARAAMPDEDSQEATSAPVFVPSLVARERERPPTTALLLPRRHWWILPTCRPPFAMFAFLLG